MSRVITFSRFFPKGHPKEGQPTYFVEKIWAGLADQTDRMQGSVDMDWHEYYNGVPKWHTIRAGNRWKVGDFFSPRYWTGKPYASKQALITEPIEIVKIWDITIGMWDQCSYSLTINGKQFGDMKLLAQNDGLSLDDFMGWFPLGKIFEGQILCWDKNIEYDI